MYISIAVGIGSSTSSAIGAGGGGSLPLTDATFNQAITDILAQDPNGDYDLAPYGKIQNWNVSQVTNMSFAFNQATFNGNISAWDTRSVTNMRFMFSGALAFNQPIGNWDVSKVIDMTFMLYQVPLSPVNYDSLLIGWNKLEL